MCIRFFASDVTYFVLVLDSIYHCYPVNYLPVIKGGRKLSHTMMTIHLATLHLLGGIGFQYSQYPPPFISNIAFTGRYWISVLSISTSKWNVLFGTYYNIGFILILKVTPP